MKFKKIVGLVCFLAVAMSVTGASGQLEVVQEHIFEIAASATPWEMPLTIPFYDPAQHGGASLEEVMVMLEGSANSTVDVTASGGDVVVLNGEVGAYITASGFINGLELNVLPKGNFAPPAITVPNSTSINLTDVSGYDMDLMILMDAGDLTGFVGTGDYEVNIDALGTSSLTTSGGNMDASQRTDASARLTVQYKAIPVPEPGTFLFLVIGLVGVSWLRRR